MRDNLNKPINPWVAIVALLLTSSFLLAVAIQVSPNSASVTVELRGPGAGKSIDTTRDDLRATQTEGVKDHVDLKDETPTGVTGAQVKASVLQRQRLAASNPLADLSPLATPQQRGCRSQFVGNYSSRHGVRPVQIVVHYTVSPNLPGFRDINALTAFANNPASGVSWHYNMDSQGNCAYTVRETDNAWTQATFNRVSLGIEFVSTGRPGDWLTARGKQRAGRLLSDMARRWDIPLRRGATRGCVVTSRGIVQHADLGVCGGGHDDINPFSTNQLIRYAQAYRRRTSTTARRCVELAAIRQDIRRHVSTTAQRDRARVLKSVLGPRATTCR